MRGEWSKGLIATTCVVASLIAGRAAVAEPACNLTAAEIYARAAPQVVEVFAVSINPFRVADRVMPRGGSAFVIGDGFLVTNYHVIADARDIAVFTGDTGTGAGVVGIDPSLDIAVLAPWEPVASGPPLELFTGPVEIGQPAYALGFPLGIGKSISQGIISGVNRVLPVTTFSWLSPHLQTDAAISPGNSGGPLLDDCGRVLGMISASSQDGIAENLGFAIPSATLIDVTSELIENGYVSRPWHGLYGQMVTPAILLMLGVPEQYWEQHIGFLIETIEPGSAADRAGLLGGHWPVNWGMSEVLLGGDIVTEANGRRIASLEDAVAFTRGMKVGDEVQLTYLRDGEERQTSVVLEERPLQSQELEIYRHSR